MSKFKSDHLRGMCQVRHFGAPNLADAENRKVQKVLRKSSDKIPPLIQTSPRCIGPRGPRATHLPPSIRLVRQNHLQGGKISEPVQGIKATTEFQRLHWQIEGANSGFTSKNMSDVVRGGSYIAVVTWVKD